jgi:hypothetical protein
MTDADPPKPPPTLVDQVARAITDEPDDPRFEPDPVSDLEITAALRVLAVVRAAVEGHTDWPDRWAGVSSIEREAYRDGRADAIRVVLALLGGNDE